ncbi:unnamed protein product [Hymenolepis diminuta]|uniref:PPV_E1_C domain-containing protein n=1 Tax=Hymenolepis diminuta TaxID=6216 RepID=A0A0R3SYK2_HYMDI|nr:unnamed protein product [Hymenolepis diminuta]
MRRTNSGYEICELQWELKPNDEIPENVKNLDLIGRIEISLPQYEDYGDEEVHWEDTYTANFKIIDRHYEMETCRALYTFIWNNGPSTSADPNFDLIETPPISPNAVLGIYHGNHWHIQFFSSSKNAHRKMDYVIRFILNGTVPEETKASMLIKCSVTRQLIRNPINFMRYLVVKFNGQEILIPPDIVGECYNVTEMKRLNMREELAMKTRNKFERERSLFDLFKSLNIQFEEEFNEWLKTDPNQLPNIWAKYGQNWRTKLHKVIHSECPDLIHDPNPIEGAYYLRAIFEANNISLGVFLNDVNDIICMKHPRLNALVLRGPTTTEKSLIAKNLVKPYNYGTVSRDGDATAFYLQNLLDHEVALMEEPHISMTTVQNFKELLTLFSNFRWELVERCIRLYGTMNPQQI